MNISPPQMVRGTVGPDYCFEKSLGAQVVDDINREYKMTPSRRDLTLPMCILLVDILLGPTEPCPYLQREIATRYVPSARVCLLRWYVRSVAVYERWVLLSPTAMRSSRLAVVSVPRVIFGAGTLKAHVVCRPLPPSVLLSSLFWCATASLLETLTLCPSE